MPPNKRAQRGRVNKEVDNTADSSPSRPVKRRKKADPAEEQALPRTQDEIQMDDEDIVVAAIQVLAMPEHPVAAALDHANTVHEQHNSTGVQAYAKLAGKDWTFYIKKLRINIGRPPEAPTTPVEQNGDTDSDPEAEDKKTHVNLGPSKMVSRDHAQVYYEGEAEKWYILINGRNGIRLDGEQRRRGEIIPLVSGQVIEIGGVEMMFVLPHDGSLKINKTFLIRANLITDNQNDQNGVHNLAAPGPPLALHQFSQAQAGGYNGPQPIAPAPPNYHRPGTPNSAQQNLYNSNQTYIQPSYKNSPNFNGTMVMHGDDVDLALDSNQHIKPAFSYAQLIAQAILESPEEKITLSGIYDFITKNWAYYRWQPAGGWQNSIRHNLSLNKAFTKVARSTEEPGKGMKWIIQPEAMDDMRRNAHRSGRGGHRGSSAPSSPAILSQGYVDHNSKVMAGENELGSAQKGSPRSGSPHMSSSFPLTGPQFTPDRGRQLLTSFQDHLRNNNSRSNSHTNSHNSNSHHNLPNSQHHHHQLPGDGSPLPRNRRPQPPSAFGFSDNIPGSPPVLSSSYQQEDNSFVTPAPHRHFPRLAPPSTAQKPSEVMPTSSPAPFWKYADLTPRKGSHFESSPIKSSTAPSAVPPSSSPPPTHLASPTRIGPSTMKRELLEDLDEDEGFDLTKPFQSIGEYHATSGQPVAPLHGR